MARTYRRVDQSTKPKTPKKVVEFELKDIDNDLIEFNVSLSKKRRA